QVNYTLKCDIYLKHMFPSFFCIYQAADPASSDLREGGRRGFAPFPYADLLLIQRFPKSVTFTIDYITIIFLSAIG
ncbi:MAG: hypothetical protein IKH71_14870, partial [Oscillospiraceae bacterium]|nr:hypothetical protein [Oscillospiraceae bacterium]